MKVGARMLRSVDRVFGGWPFPVFLICTVVSGTLMLTVVLIAPTEGTALEQFAEDFRRWCFAYDPATGRESYSYAVAMLTSPMWLIGVTLFVWWQPLRDVWQHPRRILAAAAPAMVLVGALSAGIGVIGSSPAHGDDLPFPAERLRLGMDPVEFGFVDQTGQEVSLEALRGRVVVITGLYASCPHTCPLIVQQARAALDALPEQSRAAVSVVGITFDPEHDDVERLAAMAAAHGIGPPGFHLVTGEAGEVDRVLDSYGFSRSRDPDTGVIDHANLFIVIDRAGLVAYRFSLGERQEQWLAEALGLLVAEPAPT